MSDEISVRRGLSHEEVKVYNDVTEIIFPAGTSLMDIYKTVGGAAAADAKLIEGVYMLLDQSL